MTQVHSKDMCQIAKCVLLEEYSNADTQYNASKYIECYNDA